MDEKPKEDLQVVIADLTAGLLLDGAAIRTLQGVVLQLAKKAGLEEIDGVPLATWMAQQNKKHLQETTFRVEDLSPEAAAQIQAALNRGEDTAQQMQQRKPDTP